MNFIYALHGIHINNMSPMTNLLDKLRSSIIGTRQTANRNKYSEHDPTNTEQRKANVII